MAADNKIIILDKGELIIAHATPEKSTGHARDGRRVENPCLPELLRAESFGSTLSDFSVSVHNPGDGTSDGH